MTAIALTVLPVVLLGGLVAVFGVRDSFSRRDWSAWPSVRSSAWL
jgi:hypothetical protein